MDIREKIWRQVEPSVFISRRAFLDGLEGWDVTPKELDGETIGATLTHGPEFHFVTFRPGKAFSRSLIADCLRPIIERHGFARTRTPRDDARQRRFNLLIGFRVESEDEYFTHFRMNALNLHKAKPCLS